MNFSFIYFFGAHDRIRTGDLILTKDALYHLSYMGFSLCSSDNKWSGKRDSNSRPSAWKADALPIELFPPGFPSSQGHNVVEGGGFEPPKALPTDLQSVPFSHSGTPPREFAKKKQTIFILSTGFCKELFSTHGAGDGT